MTNLAERIEQSDGPSRELDDAIWQAFHPDWHSAGHMRMFRGGKDECPLYTASLDAAMTLVPEGWGPLIDCTDIGTGVKVELYCADYDTVFASAKTPALALLAACVRAKGDE